MKVLVIGAAGFVGPYLIRHLTADMGATVFATKLPQETLDVPNAAVLDLDILQPDAIAATLAQVQPDWVVHLAAQSSVALSWKKPNLTVAINVQGTVNVLEALRGQAQPPKLLMIGSGEEYGIHPESAYPIAEAAALHPCNLYAATKACAEQIALIYAKAYGMHIVSVRAFNHIGPGQTPQFVVSDFCKQAVEIECGLHEPVIRTGNLSSKRDFTDVRDVVRAYGALMECGTSGMVYNVGSGHAIAIEQVLQMIQAQCRVPFTVEPDPARIRPVDAPMICADIPALQRDTGWMPEISLAQTLTDTLDAWRAQYQS